MSRGRVSRLCALVVLAGALVTAGCAGEKDATSLVIRVETDLAVGTEIDAITINGLETRLLSLADLPVVRGFFPSRPVSEPAVITVVGRLAATEVVRQSFATMFVPGQAALLVFHLDRACRAVGCGAEMTCERGSCVSATRQAGPFPGPADGGGDRTGGLDTAPDLGGDHAGAADGRDGGPSTGGDGGDARLDAGASADTGGAGTGGAGTGGADTGSDAPVDRGPADAPPDVPSDRSGPEVPAPFCGDGRVDTALGETCDQGSADTSSCNGAGAPAAVRCKAATCGDGYINAAVAEGCDDGNRVAGDGCSAVCAVQAGYICTGAGPQSCRTVCGDGVVAGAETCDDHNTLAGDGCSAVCATERGYTCTGAGPQSCRTVCGDGIATGLEICDDFNTLACGTCNASCTGPGSGGGCVPGTGCVSGSDCNSGVCTLNICAFPTCTDNVQNDVESDIDCGGSGGCPGCSTGSRCSVGTDCQSDFCNGICG